MSHAAQSETTSTFRRALWGAILVIVTGGLALPALLAVRLPTLWRRAWSERASWVLGLAVSPWPWIGRTWMAWAAGLPVLPLLGILLGLLGSAPFRHPGASVQEFRMAALMFAAPQFLVAFIIVGTGLTLSGHTLLHGLRLPKLLARARNLLPGSKP